MSMIYKGRINKTLIIGAGEGAEANEWAEISNEVIAIDKNPTNYGFKSNVKFLCKNNYLSRYLLPSNIVILTKIEIILKR